VSWDLKTGKLLPRVRIPPVLTNRECLDSVITCRVCWNGISSQGVVFIRDPLTNTAVMRRCPECHGTREMKSTTKEEKLTLWKGARDQGIPKHTIPGVTHL
jgi:hypothetical protein